MSAPEHGYHVQTTATQLRNGFPYFSHHDSVSALWSGKWRRLSAAGIYPFVDGNVEDFDPIFAQLIETSGDDAAVLYRPDDYAEPFLPVAQRLADAAASDGDSDRAKELYLRAAAVYRIARFPVARSPRGQKAWELGKAAYEQAGLLLDPPSVPLQIPFAHADTAAGDAAAGNGAAPVQAYLRVPAGEPPKDGWLEN